MRGVGSRQEIVVDRVQRYETVAVEQQPRAHVYGPMDQGTALERAGRAFEALMNETRRRAEEAKRVEEQMTREINRGAQEAARRMDETRQAASQRAGDFFRRGDAAASPVKPVEAVKAEKAPVEKVAADKPQTHNPGAVRELGERDRAAVEWNLARLRGENPPMIFGDEGIKSRPNADALAKASDKAREKDQPQSQRDPRRGYMPNVFHDQAIRQHVEPMTQKLRAEMDQRMADLAKQHGRDLPGAAAPMVAKAAPAKDEKGLDRLVAAASSKPERSEVSREKLAGETSRQVASSRPAAEAPAAADRSKSTQVAVERNASKEAQAKHAMMNPAPIPVRDPEDKQAVARLQEAARQQQREQQQQQMAQQEQEKARSVAPKAAVAVAAAGTAAAVAASEKSADKSSSSKGPIDRREQMRAMLNPKPIDIGDPDDKLALARLHKAAGVAAPAVKPQESQVAQANKIPVPGGYRDPSVTQAMVLLGSKDPKAADVPLAKVSLTTERGAPTHAHLLGSGRALPVPVPPGVPETIRYQPMRFAGQVRDRINPQDFHKIVEAVAKQERVHPALLYAVAKKESDFISRPGMGGDGRSSHGVAQVTLPNARSLLNEKDPGRQIEALNHPVVSITLAARLLKEGDQYASRMIARNGDANTLENRIKYMSTSYNTTSDWRNKFDGDVSKMPDITRGHMHGLMRGMKEYQRITGRPEMGSDAQMTGQKVKAAAAPGKPDADKAPKVAESGKPSGQVANDLREQMAGGGGREQVADASRQKVAAQRPQ